MSGFLSALVNGDDQCGPVNPVAQLTKGLHGGADSVSRDRFIPIAGPSSSQSFRTHNLQPHEAESDAAARAFFAQQHEQQAHRHANSPFDLERLRQALPPGAPAWAADFANASQGHAMSERAWEKSRAVEGKPAPAWADDFAAHLQRSASHTPMSNSPMRMTSPPPLASQANQFQPLHSGNACVMYNQPPMHLSGYSTPQYMPIYNQQQAMFAENQFMQPQVLDHAQPQNATQGPKTTDTTASDMTWESAFLKHLQQSPKLAAAISEELQEEITHESLTARPHSPSQIQNPDDPDLLSRTAKELLENIQHDLKTNDKMNSSSFMHLMRKLRDKEVKVEGNKMVEAIDPVATGETAHVTPSVKVEQPVSQLDASFSQPICSLPLNTGQESMHASASIQTLQNQLPQVPEATEENTREFEDLASAYDEMNSILDEENAGVQHDKQQRAFVGDGGAHMLERDFDDEVYEPQASTSRINILDDTAVRGASSAWEEDMDDFDLDEELLRSGPAPPTMEQINSINPQQAEWAQLQNQWEEFNATSTGIEAASSSKFDHYPFHQRNPYLLNAVSQSNYRSLPMGTLLDREAQVQMNPTDPVAWLKLGLKQQEAEREGLAIQALLKALELDATLKEAWMALAVSYTNDNFRGKAYEAIERWVACKTEYSDLTQRFEALNRIPGDEMSTTEKHHYLTGMLVEMARAGSDQEHGIDPEVQIALGVLFNASEEYDKACDCFHAALSVRPNDPHLFNRLGATLANSGKAQQSIEYYYKALELQPDFARATVNLAIACINLNEYQEAADHLLRALAMQQASDADVGDLSPSLTGITEAEYVESSTLLWNTLATCCNSLGRSDLAQACAKRNLAPFREGVLA